MASRTFSFAEPHPSVPKSGACISGGRGGAGNYRRYKPEDLTSGPDATGPASRISLSKSFKRQASLVTGRGGAGNVWKPASNHTDEQRVFQFDEEMVKRRDLQAPVYHIGRGGAANWIDERGDDSQHPHALPPPARSTRMDSTSSISSGSVSSDTSGNNNNNNATTNVKRTMEGALNKFTRRFS